MPLMGSGPLQVGVKPTINPPMSEPNPLLSEINVFLNTPGVHMSETGFGMAVMKDGKFISELRKGRKILTHTEQKVREYMEGVLGELRAAHRQPEQTGAAP